jgi:hypothetical protein
MVVRYNAVWAALQVNLGVRQTTSFNSQRILRRASMEPKDWIALAGLAATAFTSAITLFLTSRREHRQQERDDRLRREGQEREERIRAQERALVPRVRVDLECRFLGPEHGRYLAEFRIIVDNAGRTRRSFAHMMIRLRGILAGTTLERWAERDPSRVKFPLEIAKADLVPPGEYYYYVEPGVRQTFTYVTDVPADVAYVLAHVKLEAVSDPNDKPYETTFTEERLYALNAPAVAERTRALAPPNESLQLTPAGEGIPSA